MSFISVQLLHDFGGECMRVDAGQSAMTAISLITASDALFDGGAEALKREVKSLMAVSDAMSDALAWDRITRGRAPMSEVHDADKAKGFHGVLRQAAGPIKEANALDLFWQKVRDTRCTLNTIRVGQNPGQEAVTAAGDFCRKIGDSLISAATKPSQPVRISA